MKRVEIEHQNFIFVGLYNGNNIGVNKPLCRGDIGVLYWLYRGYIGVIITIQFFRGYHKP